MKYKITYPELLIQLIIIVSSMDSMAISTRWWYLHNSFPDSFVAYFNAGNGYFDPNYVYSRWLAISFQPLTWIEPLRSFARYSGVQTFCYMILIHKLFEVKYGWTIAIITIPGYISYLKGGNIQIILCLAAIYPIPSLLAILYKPYFAVYSFGLAIAEFIRFRSQSRKTIRKG
jgi:hypothetical protein